MCFIGQKENRYCVVTQNKFSFDFETRNVVQLDVLFRIRKDRLL